MTRYHPHQCVYFNRLAGPDMATIKQRFDLDYWGLSYRKGLEYILRNDPRDTIPVNVVYESGPITANILRPEERARLQLVSTPGQADYFVSTYLWHPEEYNYPNFYEITVGNAKILGVYKPDK